MERVRQLIESTKEPGFQSPWLDRLRARKQSSALGSLQQEILGEMAASLGRAEANIEEALLACELLGKDVDELGARGASPEELAAAVRAFNEQRLVAQRRIWELVVQREALGLRRHELVERLYPVPPAKRS